MRYREIINEAPIADFQVVNKETEKYYNDFDKSDEGILNSPKGIQKIKHAFEKTPFEFNIYVVMRPTEGIWGNDFDTTQADALEFLKDQIGDVQTAGRITCVYLSNVTGRNNRMPMNAWTIAHRIIHMMQTSAPGGKQDLLAFERTLWSNLVKVADASTNIHPRFMGSMLQMAAPEKPMVHFANAIMTQKSARDNRITNSLDVGGEALAQYLLTGGIRFNEFSILAQKFTDNQKARKEANPRDMDDYSILPDVDRRLVNKMIIGAEKNSMVACRDTLKGMVGKVFWF